MDYATAQSKDFPYSFFLTKDIDLLLPVKIATVEGSREKKPFTALLEDPALKFTGVQTSDYSDIYVTCQIFADNKPLTVPIRTSHKPFENRWAWNEWLVLPIKYRDLPVTAQLALTVWDIQGPRKVAPIGGTTIRLFGKNNSLKEGKHKLYLWPEREADGSVHTATTSKIYDRGEMDRLEKRYDKNDIDRLEWLDNLAFRQIEKINQRESSKSKKLYLYIILPKFEDFPAIFSEPEYELSVAPPLSTTSAPIQFVPSTIIDSSMNVIVDPEITCENPVEAKHRRLVRSHRNGPLDRDLKPNAKIRDELNQILKYPPTKSLTSEEKDLLWKFRFYLTRDKKALTKFLKCVVWTDPTEAKQAVDLLSQWADIDVDDSLELLGANFVNRAVRGYAVGQLQKADDDELLLYLLQLVQAFKFENISEKSSSSNESSLVAFLIDRAIKNPILGNNFHWYLMVECEDKLFGKMYARVAYQYLTAMTMVLSGGQRRDILLRQGVLIETLSKISKSIYELKDIRPKKIEMLRTSIADPKHALLSFPPLPLPLDAGIEVTGIIPEKSTVFKSSLLPLSLVFSCVGGTEYPNPSEASTSLVKVIFKTGDDLRQDQLVIQIITLMDKLLRKENLDLKLKPYKVLATSSDHGLMQFIPSSSLANILSEYNGSLLLYLKAHHPDEKALATYGVNPEVMDTYVKSCAGYCVITYLLGVGDRHLDNLLLSPEGHVFHVDFGFILGRDPKPFPPPMKLCKEMVEAMGGANSSHYQRFKSYCYVAFNILRKNANLILNLFALMVDANIPDIKIEPDKAVWKVQEKFRLDLTEEEAIKFFQNLINDSVSALFPQVIETIHKWGQYWRK
ncbi:11263_t:CDS:10 [Ambispora gerdemannii]|uniref:Phosphatidylinositol 3-kinase VPS34 n=1 Tax=Ambispora gerdemannii TaxID=144530 RepID=A0A9N8V0J9_9GLOM|nr:11263_t:CDS:10 [Ambispora gerdemannii]